MPPRKEPKETVTYPASKRKAPPFKPLRPTKVGRIGSAGSEASTAAPVSSIADARSTTSHVPKQSTTAKPRAPAARVEKGTGKNMTALANKSATATKARNFFELSSGESDDEDVEARSAVENSDSDHDDELDTLQLAQGSERPVPPLKPPPARHPSSEPPPSDQSDNAPPPEPANNIPSQSDTIPSVPQPLLVRLLHEHFADKSTKIDKQAIQVLEKYLEVFVREAIARAALHKRGDVEAGVASQSDVGWLELPDLEKVAAGLLLDF